MLLDLVKHLLQTTAFHEGLGLFTASSPIIPSLHRLKPSIFKLFKPLPSFLHVTWSSETFVAIYSVLWTCENFSTFYYITACTIWIFYRSVNDRTFIAPTKRSYFYTLQTSSFILIRYLIQCNLYCEMQWGLNFQKFQYNDSLYYVIACRIRIIPSSVTDCTFIAPTET